MIQKKRYGLCCWLLCFLGYPQFSVLATPAQYKPHKTTARPRIHTSQRASKPQRWAEALRVAKKHGCLICHSTDGTEGLAPSLRGLFGTIATLHNGKKRLRDKAFLRLKIRNSAALELAGNRNVMPIYLTMKPRELNLLVEWIASLKSPGGKPTKPTSAPTSQPLKHRPVAK